MTPTATELSYHDRLNRVVDHIYDHLEEDIDLDRLAEVACLSRFHWHRIYTAMRGETVAATVKRLRLQRAADRLANSDAPVGEIARRAGYGALEAFSRAFKAGYGQSPAAYRASGSHATFKAALKRQSTRDFTVTIEALPAVRCAGVAHRGSYMEIDKAMSILFSGLTTQGLLSPDATMLAQFFDDPDAMAECDLRSMACSPLAEGAAVTSPLVETTLRGGTYARLRYQGPYADMRNAYRWLFGVWLPQSGREADDAPAFEAYRNSPQEVSPSELITDIHLPLVGPA